MKTATQLIPGGYKQTEAGVIPEDWSVRSLDSLGKRGRPPIKAGPFGSTLTKTTYVATGYKIYGQEQVIRGDHLYGDYFISREHYNRLKSCAVEPGDILLSLVGTAGRILLVPKGAAPGIINPRLMRLSFDDNLISGRYFKFLFQSDCYQTLLSQNAQGGTMGVLNASVLRPIPIPLPTLAEQEAIAEALGDADALIESLEQLVAKKRHLKQAAMQQLLTGKKRLPGFTGEWRQKAVGELAELRNGYAFKSATYTETGSFKVVTIANVQDGRMELSECNAIAELPRDLQPYHRLKISDLLISMTGNVGRVCRVSHRNCVLNQRVGLLEPTGTSADYLFHLLSQRTFLTSMIGKAKGGAQGNLSKGDILEFALRVPVDPREQTAIAEVLSDMDAEIKAIEAKLAKARQIKQGMMQELLTGRIRLV